MPWLLEASLRNAGPNTSAVPLEQLAAASSMSFPHLLDARKRTLERLTKREHELAKLTEPDVSVALMGSWGRREVTSGSDDDYMLLVDGAWRPDYEVNPSIEDVASILDAKPEREGTFGDIVFSDPSSQAHRPVGRRRQQQPDQTNAATGADGSSME